MQAANYQRHVDCVDHQEGPHYAGHGDGWTAANSGGQRERCHREVHFAFLPEKYKPLVDEEARVKAKEERKKKKKEQYKIVKKNVGRAIRATWKCLMLGLYNFALGYSTPITTFVPDFHPGRDTR
uniref:Uncharacterized protein n=1 Tax=Mola mola TaxID=94237 RepID=A0A3Q3WZL0_MOLML